MLDSAADDLSLLRNIRSAVIVVTLSNAVVVYGVASDSNQQQFA